MICCGFRCKCPGPFWAHPGYSPCLTPNDWRIFSTVQMCEDINIATLRSSTWLVFTHGAVATNETGWSVPTVGLTFDYLQQNLTYVALALQRSQAHFTQPLLWVRPAGQLPQPTTRRPTSFLGKHLGTKVLVPRPYPNHQKTRYPGGNFQSSDPTWSPRSPWQVNHFSSSAALASQTLKRWFDQKGGNMHGKRNGCEVCPFLMWQWCPWQTFGWFLFSICNRTRHLVTFALSTSFLILRMFSRNSPRRILNEWTGRKKTGLDRRDGGPRTVLDTRWSQQNTRTKDCLSESCSSSKTMASTESSSPRKVSRMPLQLEESKKLKPEKPIWLAHFFWHNKQKEAHLPIVLIQDLRFQVPSPNWIP